jgi:hypothetical protein
MGKGPDKRKRTTSEIRSITVVDQLPEGIKPVDTKWVYVIKRKPDRFIEKYKARKVGRGFTQEDGINYDSDKTSSQMMRPETWRMILVIYLFIQVYCPYGALGYERPTPHLLTDITIHSDTQAEPRKLSSLTLYIDFWQEGKPAPGQNPPVISPLVVIFRRIGVRAEIRTQNPVLSNTRLAKMVPLSHLRRHE